MKKLAILLFATLLAINAYSAFLRNVPVELKQPDGAVIQCFVTGDEYHRRVHDKDNYTIVQNIQTGYYVYAQKTVEKLVPSDHVVGKSDPKQLGIEPNIDIPSSKMEDQRTEVLKSAKIVTETPTKGNFNNIVISIRFSDQNPTPLTLQDYEDKFNSTTQVSLKSYYKEVSNSQLNITSYFFPKPQNQTIIEYQDLHPRSYYSYFNETSNPIGYKDSERSEREQTLLKNAIEFIKDQIVKSEINFDANNDGLIDNIVFVIQGNPDNWGNILWPQTSSIQFSLVNIGNKQVNHYNKQLSSMFNAPVICHEFFHSLGAPDLYRYTTNLFDTVGPWDLMGWTGDQSPTVYMKWRYGKWIENLPEITKSGSYNLKAITNSPYACYKIASPNSANEYFIIEYRKKGSIIDQSLPGEGLIVYRIIGNMYGAGDVSGPPDEVYVYRPGGTSEKNGTILEANYAKDFNRGGLNDLTDPSCFLSDGQPGGIQLSNINAIGDEMNFDVSFNKSVIAVQTPNGNESWKIGTTKEIKWSILNVDMLKIDYSLNGGNEWINLAKNISGSTKKYLWKLPEQVTTNAIVRVSAQNNDLIYDHSDNVFMIRDEDYLTEKEPNNFFSTASVIEIGDSIKGILKYFYDYDFYKFYVDTAILLDITVRSENVINSTSTSIFIYDSNREYVYPHSYSNSLSNTFTKSGWYYIKFFCGSKVEIPYWLSLKKHKPTAPNIEYFEACNIYPNSAIFWASLKSSNLKTFVSFKYSEYDINGNIPQDSVKYNYTVEARNNPYSNQNLLRINSPQIDNLKPNTTYICKIKAENELGKFESKGVSIFRTPNNANGWERQELNVPNNITGISFIDENTGTLALNSVLSKGKDEADFNITSSLMRTSNCGLSWEYQMKQVPPDCYYGFSGVDMINTNIAIAYEAGLLLTKDGGNSWLPKNIPIPLFQIQSSAHLSPENWYLGGRILSRIGEVGVEVGKVIHTIDGGDNWIGADKNFDASIISIAFMDANNGMMITADKKIFRTFDGGENWNLIYEGKDFKPIKLIFLNKKWIVAGYDGIIYSSNMGESWERAEIQMGNPSRMLGWNKSALLTCIAFSDSLNGIAAGRAGVIVRTKNGGRNWFFEESGTINDIMDVAFKGKIAWAVGETGLLLKKEIDLRNEVPVANAGSDWSVNERTTISLDGSASFNPLGGTLTYKWAMGSSKSTPLTSEELAALPFSPEAFITVGTNGLETKIIKANEGTKVFMTFSATDDRTHLFQFTDKALESVFVMFSKSEGGKSITFPAPTFGSYEFLVDGTEKGSLVIESTILSSSTTCNPIFTAPEVQKDTTFIFSLVVNNGMLDSQPDQVAITVKNVNKAPVANAGVDQSVNEGATVSLDGSLSTDPDGSILTYKWTAPAGITLSSTAAAKPTFTAPEVTINTNYTFSLVVNDGTVFSPVDQVVIIVKNVNKAPVANAGIDQSVNEGSSVSLDASASSDPDGNLITYKWTAPAGIALSSNTAVKPTFTAPEVITNTNYTFSLVVNDGTVDSPVDQVVITVKNVNKAPVANAGIDQSVNEGSTVFLDGSSSSDPDGDALTYKWTAPSGITMSSTTIARPTFTAPEVTANTNYTFSLVVNDGTVDSPADQVVITVKNVNKVPVANAGIDQSVNEGSTVSLDGSTSSDPDGNPITYKWTAPAGITLSSTTTAKPGFTAPEVTINTNYTFSLVVNDGMVDSQVDQVVITVKNVNKAPVANAGVDQSVNEGAYVSLDGSASSDPDGNPLTYKWTAPAGITLSSTTVAKPTFAAPEVTTNTNYTFSLVVNDGTVDSPVDQVVITVKNVNKAPVANAGVDQSVNEGATVSLDGSASSDADGTSLTYKWTAPTGIALSSMTIAKPTFTAPEVKKDSTLNFLLVVNDGLVSSLPSTVKVTVLNVIKVGVTEISVQHAFKVYPNPVTNELIIEFEDNSTKTDFQILNSIGQVVFTGVMLYKTVVQTNHFTPGIYFIKLKSGETFEFKKIVKS